MAIGKAALLLAVVVIAIAVEAVPSQKRRLNSRVKSVSCSLNKDCASCVVAKGSSKLRGEYKCNWNKVLNVCGSEGQLTTLWNFHKNRITDPDWAKAASACVDVVAFDKQMEKEGLSSQQIQRMVTIVNNFPPLDWDEKLMEARALRTDIEKITAVGNIMKEVAVIDCEFSPYCTEKCQAKTFTSGPWNGCNLYTLFNEGCGEPKMPIKNLNALPMQTMNMKVNNALTNDENCQRFETKEEKNACTFAVSAPNWTFITQRKAAVCATFAGAGMHVLHEIGVTGKLQWVKEPYYSMGRTAGHEYILYGNTGTINEPSADAKIIDFWYQGLGEMGSECGGACYTIQAGKKTVKNHVAGNGAVAADVQSFISERGLHVFYSLLSSTKKCVARKADYLMEYQP
jgi:hypothetical protein